MAQTVLRATTKLVQAETGVQQAKMSELIRKIKDAYSTLCDAKQLPVGKTTDATLGRIACQTVECGQFISAFLQDTKGCMCITFVLSRYWADTMLL
jgi:hypothetical protein